MKQNLQEDIIGHYYTCHIISTAQSIVKDTFQKYSSTDTDTYGIYRFFQIAYKYFSIIFYVILSA